MLHLCLIRFRLIPRGTLTLRPSFIVLHLLSVFFPLVPYFCCHCFPHCSSFLSSATLPQLLLIVCPSFPNFSFNSVVRCSLAPGLLVSVVCYALFRRIERSPSGSCLRTSFISLRYARWVLRVKGGGWEHCYSARFSPSLLFSVLLFCALPFPHFIVFPISFPPLSAPPQSFLALLRGQFPVRCTWPNPWRFLREWARFFIGQYFLCAPRSARSYPPLCTLFLYNWSLRMVMRCLPKSCFGSCLRFSGSFLSVASFWFSCYSHACFTRFISCLSLMSQKIR